MKLLKKLLTALLLLLEIWRVQRDTKSGRDAAVSDAAEEKEKRDALARKIDADSAQRTDDFRL